MGACGEYKERLIKILIEVTGNQGLAIDLPDSTDIINEIGLDSIQMINFVLLIEDEFRIEIDFENFNVSNLQSISVLCEYIADKLKVLAKA
jgi:acyl carrier protein